MVEGWGHCMHCKHFDSPAQLPLATEEANCQHDVLRTFKLRVFGTNGCSGFELRAGIPLATERPDGQLVLDTR
jgi:hypothetical protein